VAIARQIGEHLLRTAERRIAVDHPLLAVQRAKGRWVVGAPLHFRRQMPENGCGKIPESRDRLRTAGLLSRRSKQDLEAPDSPPKAQNAIRSAGNGSGPLGFFLDGTDCDPGGGVSFPRARDGEKRTAVL
jgi:hypothetical protein